MKKMKVLTGITVLLLSTTAFADAINFSGTIADSTSGEPIAQANLKFDAKVKSGSCVLYQETQSGIDMSNSAGRFSLNIGEGTAVGAGTLANVFAVGPATCADGSNSTLTFSSPKTVDITVTASDGSVLASMANLPLKNAGSSLSAKSLNGKTETSFIQTSTNITQAAIEALASGASTLYAKAADTAASLANYYTKSEVDTAIGSKEDKSKLKALAYKDKADFAADLLNVPATFAPAPHTHVIADVTGLSTSLSSKLNTSDIAQCGAAGQTMIWTAGSGYSCVNSTPDYANIVNKPKFGALANLDTIDWNWSLITNKPVIGTAASQDVGFSANNVMQLDSNGKIPAFDGSQLIGVTLSVPPAVNSPAPSVQLSMGTASNNGAGGSGVISISSGTTKAGNSGAVNVSTGLSTSGTSGGMNFSTGNAISSAGSSGSFLFKTGSVSSDATSGGAGGFYVTTGGINSGTATATKTAGSIKLQTGNTASGGTFNDAGVIELLTGDSYNAGNQNINLKTGNGSQGANGGSINLIAGGANGGSQTSGSGAPGSVSITAGNHLTNQGGFVSINTADKVAGFFTQTGASGYITLTTGGNGNTSNASNTGDVSVSTGANQNASASSGTIYLHTGSGASATGGIVMSTGEGISNPSARTGSISITTGTSPSGTNTRGIITLSAREVDVVAPLNMAQQTTATAGTPATGTNSLYFKADNNLYMKNSSGTESQVNGSSVTPYTKIIADVSTGCAAFTYCNIANSGYQVVDKDTTSSWNSAGYYVVPATGNYFISATTHAGKNGTAFTSSNYCQLYVGTNSGNGDIASGEQYASGGSFSSMSPQVNQGASLTAGQTIYFTEYCNVAWMTTQMGGQRTNHITIYQIK